MAGMWSFELLPVACKAGLTCWRSAPGTAGIPAGLTYSALKAGGTPAFPKSGPDPGTSLSCRLAEGSFQPATGLFTTELVWPSAHDLSNGRRSSSSSVCTLPWRTRRI